MISQLLLPILGTLLAYVVFHVVQFLYNDLSSPLRGMAGPPSPSFLLGNFKQMAVGHSSWAGDSFNMIPRTIPY
jgi:hypothetical protein